MGRHLGKMHGAFVNPVAVAGAASSPAAAPLPLRSATSSAFP